MRVVTVPTQEKFLFDLLTKVHEEGLILQTIDGQQFVLLSLDGWKGFYVGDSGDFEQEVKATAENKALIAFLAARRNTNGKQISMANVKQQLGLN